MRPTSPYRAHCAHSAHGQFAELFAETHSAFAMNGQRLWALTDQSFDRMTQRFIRERCARRSLCQDSGFFANESQR